MQDTKYCLNRNEIIKKTAQVEPKSGKITL